MVGGDLKKKKTLSYKNEKKNLKRRKKEREKEMMKKSEGRRTK